MKIVYSIFISLIIISCTEDNNQFCFQTSLVENWQSEMFKTDYTIQFPDNYIGPGMISFEGNIFSKSREDSLVQFEYHYCNFNFCEDFGVELQYPLPESITMFDNQGNELELTNQIELPTPQQKSSGVVVHDEQFVKIKGIDLKRISTVDANNPNVYYDELHTNRTEDTMIEVCQEIKNKF